MNCGEADERHVVPEQPHPGVISLGLIRSAYPRRRAHKGVSLEIVVVHHTDHIFKAVGDLPSDVDEVVALLDKVNRARGAGSVSVPASDGCQVRRADNVAQPSGGFGENTERHTEDPEPDYVEIGCPGLNRSKIDIGLAKERRRNGSTRCFRAAICGTAAVRCLVGEAGALELHQGMPSGDHVADLAPKDQL